MKKKTENTSRLRAGKKLTKKELDKKTVGQKKKEAVEKTRRNKKNHAVDLKINKPNMKIATPVAKTKKKTSPGQLKKLNAELKRMHDEMKIIRTKIKNETDSKKNSVMNAGKPTKAKKLTPAQIKKKATDADKKRKPYRYDKNGKLIKGSDKPRGNRPSRKDVYDKAIENDKKNKAKKNKAKKNKK